MLGIGGGIAIGVKYPGVSPKVEVLWVDIVEGQAHESAGLAIYGAGSAGKSCTCSEVTRLSTGITWFQACGGAPIPIRMVGSCVELGSTYELMLGALAGRLRGTLEASASPLSGGGEPIPIHLVVSSAVAVCKPQGSCRSRWDCSTGMYVGLPLAHGSWPLAQGSKGLFDST